MGIRRIRLQRLEGQLGDVAYQLTKLQFHEFRPPEPTWRPAINAYRCARCVRICVDLAGVDKKEIHLSVEPGRLLIQGRRESPGLLPEDAPPPGAAAAGHGLQMLAMEIDHGPFEREVPLPRGVVAERVTAEQRNGLLWICLPLRPHA